MKTSHPGRANPAKQSGVMLLEALIALLIFSVGILAIVGMQATAFQDMGESKYRTDAAFLANQVIAEMWSNAEQSRRLRLRRHRRTAHGHRELGRHGADAPARCRRPTRPSSRAMPPPTP